jgi:hypothetical protein
MILKKRIWLFLSLCILGVACQEDEPANAITGEEAAVLIASSLASNTSGVNSVSSKSTDVTDDLLTEHEGGRVAVCGISQNIALSGESPANAAISYDYDFSYKFILNCNEEELPSEVSVDVSYSSAFETSKLGAEHSGVAELAVTGLEGSETEYVLDGLYKRSGSFTNKELEKTGSCSVEITITSVVVDKITHKIISGSGSYDLQGAVPDKGTFSYQGSVVFDGADQASINVSNVVYKANLITGDVVKNN